MCNSPCSIFESSSEVSHLVVPDELLCVCLFRLENQEEIFLGEKQRAAQREVSAELGECNMKQKARLAS